MGDKLSSLVSFEALKLAAAAYMLFPFIPLIFIGGEYGKDSPFLYFVNHSEKDFIEGVRNGRKNKFKAFNWDKRKIGKYQIWLICLKFISM